MLGRTYTFVEPGGPYACAVTVPDELTGAQLEAIPEQVAHCREQQLLFEQQNALEELAASSPLYDDATGTWKNPGFVKEGGESMGNQFFGLGYDYRFGWEFDLSDGVCSLEAWAGGRFGADATASDGGLEGEFALEATLVVRSYPSGDPGRSLLSLHVEDCKQASLKLLGQVLLDSPASCIRELAGHELFFEMDSQGEIAHLYEEDNLPPLASNVLQTLLMELQVTLRVSETRWSAQDITPHGVALAHYRLMNRNGWSGDIPLEIRRERMQYQRLHMNPSGTKAGQTDGTEMASNHEIRLSPQGYWMVLQGQETIQKAQASLRRLLAKDVTRSHAQYPMLLQRLSFVSVPVAETIEFAEQAYRRGQSQNDWNEHFAAAYTLGSLAEQIQIAGDSHKAGRINQILLEGLASAAESREIAHYITAVGATHRLDNLDTLAAYAQHDHSQVRAAASRSIARLSSDSATRKLIEFSRDRNESVQGFALRGLASRSVAADDLVEIADIVNQGQLHRSNLRPVMELALAHRETSTARELFHALLGSEVTDAVARAAIRRAMN